MYVHANHVKVKSGEYTACSIKCEQIWVSVGNTFHKKVQKLNL